MMFIVCDGRYLFVGRNAIHQMVNHLGSQQPMYCTDKDITSHLHDPFSGHILNKYINFAKEIQILL